MKKHSFYTLCKIDKKVTAILVKGSYDHRLNFYFYKKGSCWYSVCPLTGLSLASGRTKSECVEETENWISLYRNMINLPAFNQKVQRFNKAITIASATR